MTAPPIGGGDVARVLPCWPNRAGTVCSQDGVTEEVTHQIRDRIVRAGLAACGDAHQEDAMGAFEQAEAKFRDGAAK